MIRVIEQLGDFDSLSIKATDTLSDPKIQLRFGMVRRAFELVREQIGDVCPVSGTVFVPENIYF